MDQHTDEQKLKVINFWLTQGNKYVSDSATCGCSRLGLFADLNEERKKILKSNSSLKK